MQQLEVMNFLNEIAIEFPDAISMAAGRPNPKFFNKKEWNTYEQVFCQYFANKKKMDHEEAIELLCQYGPSAGIINEVLQRYLSIDESIEVDAKNILVTNGCQEALSLICLNELTAEQDCMLVIDPSYIGFAGLVNALGKTVEPVDVRKLHHNLESGRLFNWNYLEDTVLTLRARGKKPKAIYVNPDFNNPMAYRLTEADRRALLKICHKLEIKIIEDNPYNRFDYSDSSLLSLKALDNYGIVYHVGSFSKTLSPGLRVGYLVLPDNNGENTDNIISLKSLISVNTSSLTQSVVAGFLIKNNYTLNNRMVLVNQQYGEQLEGLLKALDRYLKEIPGVSWNRPEGGFFLVVNLPFDMTDKDVLECAKSEKVICMPVSFFSVDSNYAKSQIRLSFSYYDSETLNVGVQRFANYIKSRL